MRDRLKKARVERKWTFTDLAKAAGVSRVTVSNIEDARVTPGVDTVEMLASALGVSPAWLAYGILPKDPKEVQEE